MTSIARQLHTWGEMIKFSHSIFAMPFAVLATFLAARPHSPTITQFVLIVICMVGARSAAMTFNRIVDAAIDAKNPRTANRQIPKGIITQKAAWGFFVASVLAFMAGCAGFYWLCTPTNIWPLIFGLPVIGYLCFYSYTKRFTRWSHIVLGTGIALAPVGAWVAISPQTLDATAFALMLAVAFWIGGFDLIYACQDTEYDRQAGLFSVPAKMGNNAAFMLARIFHAICVASFVVVGILAELGIVYFVGVGIVAALLVVENLVVNPRDLSKIGLAFGTINGIVGVVLAILGIIDILIA